MKKFINDNLWWMLLIALGLSVYSAWAIYKEKHSEGEIIGSAE